MEKIAAPYIANLYEYGSFQGIKEKILRDYLLDKDLDVCSLDNTINPFEFENTFKILYEASKDEFFGLRFGSFLNLKALGLIYQLSLEASGLTGCVKMVKWSD